MPRLGGKEAGPPPGRPAPHPGESPAEPRWRRTAPERRCRHLSGRGRGPSRGGGASLRQGRGLEARRLGAGEGCRLPRRRPGSLGRVGLPRPGAAPCFLGAELRSLWRLKTGESPEPAGGGRMPLSRLQLPSEFGAGVSVLRALENGPFPPRLCRPLGHRCCSLCRPSPAFALGGENGGRCPICVEGVEFALSSPSLGGGEPSWQVSQWGLVGLCPHFLAGRVGEAAPQLLDQFRSFGCKRC